jgi:hypothetical protein
VTSRPWAGSAGASQIVLEPPSVPKLEDPAGALDAREQLEQPALQRRDAVGGQARARARRQRAVVLEQALGEVAVDPRPALLAGGRGHAGIVARAPSGACWRGEPGARASTAR